MPDAMNPALDMQYSAPNVMMSQPQQIQMQQQNMNMNSPIMMMNYHQVEFQKYFQMQQFPQQHNIVNAQQLQQIQSMASYHFEQYAMINEQQQALRRRQRQQQQQQQYDFKQQQMEFYKLRQE